MMTGTDLVVLAVLTVTGMAISQCLTDDHETCTNPHLHAHLKGTYHNHMTNVEEYS